MFKNINKFLHRAHKWIGRVVLLVVILLMFTICYAGRALAQTGSLPTADDFSSAINSAGENLQKFNYRTMLYVAESINCLGGVVKNCNPESAGYSAQSNKPNTAFDFGLNMISMLYQYQPVSSVQYFAYLRQKLHFPPSPAYAIGEGTKVLSPILPLWVAIRNLTYLFFVIFFIIVGLMVLFQNKIDQQTVIGIQHALPKVIISLLLITFSYAIAGLIIDLVNWLTKLIIVFFSAFRNQCQFTRPGGVVTEDCFDYLVYLRGDGVERPVNIFSLMTGLNETDELGGVIQDMLEAAKIGSFLGINAIGALIFTITVIGAIFRTFFALISAYVGIIINTIVAPLQLLGQAVPGTKGGLGNIIKSYLSHALVFPISFLLLMLAAYFVSQANEQPWMIKSSTTSFTWYPLPLGYFSLATGNVINVLLAFGILLMLPSVPQIIKDMLEVKEKFSVGSSLESLRSATRNIPIIGQFLG